MIVVLVLSLLCTTYAQCPCSDPSLCQPITTPPKSELFAFVTEPSNYKLYNYEQLSTIALFIDPAKFDPQLVCVAHSKGVRVVWGTSFPVGQLGNNTYQAQWIQNKIIQVQHTFTDGINFDVEDPLADNAALQYSDLVKTTTTTFHSAIPGSQVTVDIAWAPGCIDLRCYDYVGLADGSDFMIVMAYDEQSQIIDRPCKAGPTSPFYNLQVGVGGFLKLGISPSKLVLGLPWYGHTFECVNPTNDTVCPLAPHPWRGVQCTDAGAPEVGYSDLIKNLLPSSYTGRQWDVESKSPWFNYMSGGSRWQMWYDDPVSLYLKVMWAQQTQLRGVSMWNADALDYSNAQHVNDMWGVLNAFFLTTIN